MVLGSAPPKACSIGLRYDLLYENGTSAGLLKGHLSANKVLMLAEDTNENIVAAAQIGSTVQVDDRWVLAAFSYACHQVPDQAKGFYGFDRLRDAKGDPICPQRSVDVNKIISQSVSGGSTHSGAIRFKAISIVNMEDYNAFPWHGDCYHSQVTHSLEVAFENDFRLWFNERAAHEPYAPTEDQFRTFSFRGILEQALRDLGEWVEHDIAPSPETNYTVSTMNQIGLAKRADTRHGIQPVIIMTANGIKHLDIPIGTEVELEAHNKVHPNASAIVKIEWDVFGSEDFTTADLRDFTEAKTVSLKFIYSQPGRFTPSIRVTAQRDGNMASRWALVQNLGRVSVKVQS
ncbi:hypothetical protein MBLNU13_g09742t1 [Cladosporium sp. NU13]